MCPFVNSEVDGPHSLGAPIDWKMRNSVFSWCNSFVDVPTRWGHLLIGNWFLRNPAVKTVFAESPLAGDTY